MAYTSGFKNEARRELGRPNVADRRPDGGGQTTGKLIPLRMVVASPSDVEAERKLTEGVVADINAGVGEDRGLVVKVTKWENNAFPGFHSGGPQALIDSILRIPECDIFVAILWKHFGTPVGDAMSGTEHEFGQAFESWKRNGRPQIFFYFNQKAYKPHSKEEADQWGWVLEFQRKFPPEGLWWKYTGPANFKDLLRQHLESFIRQKFPLTPPPPPSSPFDFETCLAAIRRRFLQVSGLRDLKGCLYDLQAVEAQFPDRVGSPELLALKDLVEKAIKLESDREERSHVLAPHPPTGRTREWLNLRFPLRKPVVALGAVLIIAVAIYFAQPQLRRMSRFLLNPPTTQAEQRTDRAGLSYALIPGGRFEMGCTDQLGGCPLAEIPPHLVKISRPFWIAVTEVTVSAYRKYAESTGAVVPTGLGGGDHPIAEVTWSDATSFCQWVGGRLPTEAEWEYAARGGVAGPRYGPLDQIAWFQGNSSGTQRVASKQRNASGLYDMLGNVAEWTADWLGDYHWGEATDPKGPAAGTLRVVRGGSYVDPPNSVMVWSRRAMPPEATAKDVGFRCVLRAMN
jgi:formylglycine-generating enzyme required for sulfatase activity